MKIIHITLIEKSKEEADWLAHAISEAFGNRCEIVRFKNAGDFLIVMEQLSKPDLIITEHLVPRSSELETPDEHVVGRLVEHVRWVGITSPIIIYTHSNKHFVEMCNPGIFRDMQVTYQAKGKNTERDISLFIHTLLSKTV
ncbi:MAG: hypothetical protein WC629_02745 [Candidatus Paceibacterota bacterium]|jgi:hypothetical protein